MTEILYKELSFSIVGAAMEVHNVLGTGYLEAVYQAALAHELAFRGIGFEQFRRLPVAYKGVIVGDYVADFVVEDKVILELKAVSTLNGNHEAQAINYLLPLVFAWQSCSTSAPLHFSRSAWLDERYGEP